MINNNISSPTNIMALTVRKENKMLSINKVFHKTLSISLRAILYATFLIIVNIIT